jgi:hypothetical protein
VTVVTPTQLTVVVLILAAIVVLNLALTLAVIRRLRAGAGTPPRVLELGDGPELGAPIPTGTLAELDGAAVAGLTHGSALIAFVASGCKPCHDQLPELRSLVGERVAGGGRAVVVVQAFDDTAGEFVAAFDGLAPVVVDQDSRVAHDFGVEGYPLYVECDDGVARAARASVAQLRVPARA